MMSMVTCRKGSFTKGMLCNGAGAVFYYFRVVDKHHNYDNSF